MGRYSIVSDAERNREKTNEQAEQSDSAEDESESTSNKERVRITQRLPADLAEDIDAIQDQYNLSTRNATINFILTQGINQLRS